MFENLTGKVFGKLLVIDLDEPNRHNQVKWVCQCECGKRISIRTWDLKNKVRSCGCVTKKDLSGKIFGMLTVLTRTNDKRVVKSNKNTKWLCECECGELIIVGRVELVSGQTRSCGCLSGRKNHHSKGEDSKVSKEKRTWRNIRRRCYDENHIKFPIYGGRGIKVCDRWLGEDGFENFLEDMEECPSLDHSIDRIDNDGDYAPENCRWVTSKEQANNRRTNRILEYDCFRLNLTEWATFLGMSKGMLSDRLKKGIPLSQLIEERRV